MKREFITLRKKAISEQYSKLNNKQSEAVLATEGPLLILAGAGSGKTTVLINRIENLIRFGKASDCSEIPAGIGEKELNILKSRSDGYLDIIKYQPVEPWRILAITFTNKAAEELRNRLERTLGDESANDIWALTFHAACVRILRREAEFLGFSTNFTIYDTDDSVTLIKHIIKDLGFDPKEIIPKNVLYEISKAKEQLVSADDYLNSAEQGNLYKKKRIGQVYSEYMKRMFSSNAMDFDDLIMFTVKVLQENEDSRKYWQRKFKYILVDEYQDTNHLQYLLTSLLAGEHKNVCVVGDDDQSIYKFRGATIENILSFESQYQNCRTIRLEQNYRSTGHILDAANAVISNNKERKGKTLWTEHEAGTPLKLIICQDEHDEAARVAGKIINDFGSGINWKDNAILYRINAQSNPIEYALKRNGIPYRVFGGMRFFERSEVKDIISYLCVIVSPNDDLRLTRIINKPVRGIGDKTIEAVRDLASKNFCSMYNILTHVLDYPELSRSAPKLKEFANLIDELHQISEETSADVVFDAMIEKTGYIKALEAKSTVEDTTKAENVKEVKSGILSYINDTQDTTLAGYLADVALYTDLDNMSNDDNSVVLMTMHSAKGLEFQNVYLVGMEETLFPSIKAIGNDGEMEEERRLCYVALTRAKKQLTILAATQRTLFGKTMCNSVSRFVEEIPDEHIDKNIPKKMSYSQLSSKEYNSNYSFTRLNKQVTADIKPHPAAVKTTPAIIEFSVGDNINHRAFGDGIIVSMKPMGNDYLTEISFVSGETKKFMLRAASANMKKV